MRPGGSNKYPGVTLSEEGEVLQNLELDDERLKDTPAKVTCTILLFTVK